VLYPRELVAGSSCRPSGSVMIGSVTTQGKNSKSTRTGYTATKYVVILVQATASESCSIANESWPVYARCVIITLHYILAWGGIVWKTYHSFGCGCEGLLVES
jgi:hypothetical protein